MQLKTLGSLLNKSNKSEKFFKTVRVKNYRCMNKQEKH